MKRIIAVLSAITMAISGQAQTAEDTLVLSRSAAIEIGLKNRFDVKANQYDVQIAVSEMKAARNQWLPVISGDAQLRYSPQLRKSVIPGGVLPGFDQATMLPLTVKNESVFGLNLSQPLFDAGLIQDVRLAGNRLQLQQEKKKAAEIDIMLQISRAYLDAELRGLQKKIAADIAARNREYEQVAEGMYKNGSLIENQYLLARLDREQADQLQQQAEQSYALSLMQLRYRLNIPEGTVLQLSDSLDRVTEDLMTAVTPRGEHTEIRQLTLLQQENKLYLKKYQQSVLPSVSFGAGYAQQFLSSDFKYGTGKWWSPFSSLTLNIHIPVSNYFKGRGRIAEYRQRISRSDLLLAQKKADISYEIALARTTLANAFLNMKNAKRSYELSGTIFHNQQQQYRLGTFDYRVLLDTEKSRSTAERNYIQSAYELMQAQIDLQQATNYFNTNP